MSTGNPVSGEQSSIQLKTLTHYGSANSSPADSIELDSLDTKENNVNVDVVVRAVSIEQSDGILTDGEEADKSTGEGEPKKKKKREVWDNRVQFLLTLIGFAVGLGNVWRFSYLCARNGGSAFIFPYLIMLFLLGIPLFYMELSLGQATRNGPLKAWFKVSPNLGGIGISSLIVNSYISIYYCVIIAWVFFYLFNSFHKDLAWGNCCGYNALDKNLSAFVLANLTGEERLECSSCFNASTEFYWYTAAAGASQSINDVGVFNWKILLCLLVAWVVVYLCLFRGIQSSGKIIYFTATFPYLVLICLFFRAVTLPGAGTGLKFLFIPSDGWSTYLWNPQVWLEATTQIFFSLGLSIGALVALASYSKPRYNTLADSVAVCLINSGTSIFTSIIVFSIAGFRAAQLEIDPDLVTKGPGLAFVLFTEAILHMPGSPFWAVLFFLMLLFLGLDSQFATLEGIITVLRDFKCVKKIRKELLVAIICIIFFLMSFPFLLGNGVYLFELFDQFVGTIPLLMTGFFEFIAVGWVFGVKRFFTEFANPRHKALLWLWIIMWKWVGPIIMLSIFIGSIITEIINPLSYSLFTNYVEIEETYPRWAQFIGAVLILSSTFMIPSVLIVRLIAYQSARDEALEFLTRMKTTAQDAYHTVTRCIFVRWRGKWQPQVDEDSIPYQMEVDHTEKTVYTDDVPSFSTVNGKVE